MLQKAIERKKFFTDLGGENNVILEKIQILKHKEIPNTYFVHAKYLIGDGGHYKQAEVLETLDKDGEWANVKNTMPEFEFGGFLKDCEVCNF
jgi:hypothetical protein